MEPVQLAAILAGAVLLASMVSVEVGISVALVELALGVALGNTSAPAAAGFKIGCCACGHVGSP